MGRRFPAPTADVFTDVTHRHNEGPILGCEDLWRHARRRRHDQDPAICDQTLAQNWREGVRATDRVPFAYTCPSPGHYPWQWYWDSCFTAVSWRHFDPARSRRELESLLAAQREDGFIGHTIFWNTPLTGRRRFTYNVTSAKAAMTASVQPPVLAWAWRIAVGDPSLVPGIVRHYDWLAAHRDLDGDGLIWIVQPDESGLDASPQFDAIWGRRAHDRLGFVLLVRRNRRFGYDLQRIASAGGPVCCEVAMNVLHGLSLLALGRPSLTPTIVERMYDEATGLFAPLVQAAAEAQADAHVGGAGAAGAAGPAGGDRPSAGQGIPARQAAVLAAGAAAVSARDRAELLDSAKTTGCGSGATGAGRRGSTRPGSCGSASIRLGYASEAQTLGDRIMSAVLAQGLREYYDPYTGRGMGAVDFAWSTLVMEMLAADPGPRPPAICGV